MLPLVVGLGVLFFVFMKEKTQELLQTGPGQSVLGYVKGVAQWIEVASISGGGQLRTDAAASWNRLYSKAQTDGQLLGVNTSFRTFEEQSELYSRFLLGVGSSAAQPGFSNHQGGVAIDVAVQSSTASPAYRWLAANAPAHGWTNVGAGFSSPEYWHWEYNPKADLFA